ncbi:unnamed protein product [Onchocerca flexuosa]|uniref:Pyr_redox_2 domain-containing protein n=1 Tax=Onchocerca flexuosa TaxID=387005 RepID=A0A183H5I6_9BILA|nr:unnamed protein product [Onchocerca flexuosa]
MFKTACCLAINSLPVTIKRIECAIIDYAFLQGWMQPHKPNYSTGKRIAIIGSGPAGTGRLQNRFSGMAAAAQLNKVGHAVVVNEKKNHAGSLIRVKLLEDEGVRFITNTEIGKHVPADFLLRKSQRIVADEEDTWEGLNANGKRVIILGGGTADCIATYTRLLCFDIVWTPTF